MGLGAKWSRSGGVKFFSQQEQLLTHTHFQKPRPRQSASSNCISFIVSNYGPQTLTWLEHCAGASWEVDSEPSRGKEGIFCSCLFQTLAVSVTTHHPSAQAGAQGEGSCDQQAGFLLGGLENRLQSWLSPTDLHWLFLGSLLGRGMEWALLTSSESCLVSKLKCLPPGLGAFFSVPVRTQKGRRQSHR